MKELSIKLTLMSPAMPGSGEGWGSIIDSDIVFDEFGLPYFPARRIKGLLRESTREVLEMCSLAKMDHFLDLSVEELFGSGTSPSLLLFQNFYLEEYEQTRQWMAWAFQNFGNILSAEQVLGAFTDIRQYTAINRQTGIAEENSLRTIRVLKPGHTFASSVYLSEKQGQQVSDLLALACANLRHLGSKRNRGLGEIKCSLWQQNTNLSTLVLNQWKGVQ